MNEEVCEPVQLFLVVQLQKLEIQTFAIEAFNLKV